MLRQCSIIELNFRNWGHFERHDKSAEQHHWSECGRATSVANLDAPGRPHRSVPALGVSSHAQFTRLCAFAYVANWCIERFWFGAGIEGWSVRYCSVYFCWLAARFRHELGIIQVREAISGSRKSRFCLYGYPLVWILVAGFAPVLLALIIYGHR